MERRNLFLASCVLMATISCASSKVMPPESVRVTDNPQATEGCKYLGRAETWVGPTDKGTIDRLREEAAKLGGDLVLQKKARHLERGMKYDGDVYFCGTR